MEREVMVDARHPLVAPLYSAFQDRLYLYLEMEYCPGGSLDNFIMCVISVYLYTIAVVLRYCLLCRLCAGWLLRCYCWDACRLTFFALLFYRVF